MSNASTPKGPQPRIGHKNRGCAVGCVLLLIAGIVVTISVAYLMFFSTTRAIEAWMSEQPKDFPASTLSSEAKAEAMAKVKAFAKALDAGTTPPELLLTADEVNALLDEFSADHGIKTPAHVNFVGDKIHAELSLALRGLYLNGSGDLDIGLSQGVLQVFATNVEINGRTPPRALKELTGNYNLATPFLTDDDVKRVQTQLEFVTVTNGKLKITPKKAATPSGGS